MTLKQKIGQRLGIGLAGTSVNTTFCSLVETYKIGNIILFNDNLTDLQQAKRLCADIQALVLKHTGYPAFIAIDQEGGVVTRLPEDMHSVPGQMALACTGRLSAAYDAAAITARQLKSIGVNFNLAPVLDVNSNRNNPVIGVRSFGARPKHAVPYALQAIKAYADEGMLCCGKHFPGHGDTHVDSHLALPTVDKPLAALEEAELAPFKAAIDAGIPAIMTSHILYPQLEPQRLPATLSRVILTDLLRIRMKFQGLIISDGMEMNAIAQEWGTAKGCVMVLYAGADIAFICHNSDNMAQAADSIMRAYNEGFYDTDDFDESVDRILTYKNRYARFKTEPVAKEDERVCSALHRECLSVPDDATLCPPLGARPLFAGCLAYRSTIATSEADTSLSFANWFAAKFNGNAVVTSLTPDQADAENISSQLENATSVVIGCYNGHLNQGQLLLANHLTEAAKKMGIPAIVIAFRNPYDLADISPYAWRLAAFEYSLQSFDAVAEVISGQLKPKGRLTEVI